CFKLTPYKKDSEIFITAEKILPLAKYDDYYLNLMNKSITVSATSRRTTRQSLPKINAMLQWGVVKPGDIIKAKDRADEAILQKNGNVKVDGKEMSLQVWLKGIYGWSSVQT